MKRESDHLRHSKFAGLRQDKDARTVIKEHGGERQKHSSFIRRDIHQIDSSRKFLINLMSPLIVCRCAISKTST